MDLPNIRPVCIASVLYLPNRKNVYYNEYHEN